MRFILFKLRMFKEMGFDLSGYMAAGQNVYNTYRMTGKKLVTECVASGTGLMNIYNKSMNRNYCGSLGFQSRHCLKSSHMTGYILWQRNRLPFWDLRRELR